MQVPSIAISDAVVDTPMVSRRQHLRTRTSVQEDSLALAGSRVFIEIQLMVN